MTKPLSSQTQGTLYVISAPSGAGKTSLVQSVAEQDNLIQVSISHTTRKKRPGEEDGTNYHFVSIDTFMNISAEGGFLESAKVFGHYYGTSQQWLKQMLGTGKDVILEIDWQGAQQVKKLIPNIQTIFILPPSREILLSRLKNRGQDTDEVVKQRMHEAISEMSHYPEFDYLIINDQFDIACQDLLAIFRAQRLKIAHQQVSYQTLLENLLS